MPGPLPDQNNAKEEKEQVIVTTKVETIEEKTVKESVVKEEPAQSLTVKDAPSKTSGRQEVLKVFFTLIAILFLALLLLSFVREVGDEKSNVK